MCEKKCSLAAIRITVFIEAQRARNDARNVQRGSFTFYHVDGFAP